MPSVQLGLAPVMGIPEEFALLPSASNLENDALLLRETVHIEPMQVLRVSSLIALILLVLGLAATVTQYLLGYGRLFGLVQIFSMHNERSIPGWYSWVLPAIITLVLLMLVRHVVRRGAPGQVRWCILAFAFCLVSIDDAIRIHERLAISLQDHARLDDLFYRGWTIAGLAVVVVMAIVVYPLRHGMSSRIRMLAVLSVCIFLSGTIVLEIAGGYVVQVAGEDTLTYRVMQAFEEYLEMSGYCLFLYTLLEHLAEGRGAHIAISQARESHANLTLTHEPSVELNTLKKVV